jgi:hypothetical protein
MLVPTFRCGPIVWRAPRVRALAGVDLSPPHPIRQGGLRQIQVLARGSFTSPQDLQEKLYDYMLWYNQTACPFEWTYRPKSWSRKRGRTSARPN